ncbi:uncharacterized protein BT62DRAFT_919083 [Guyanagaster necrorhizus]|uniref:Transmembrane protein n=1 Tax=Guyanagaster necrorhizus TaxID=856835 RepID=A0A9P8ATE4_9AGAR|nr:uncharacterized protein BT62DRAFT_919083 [Guyanagaster necrorhizus MCA 3950]KAG7447110.1 hypothetical protein BT62DRAFT_919083 [Guyanagaster necrorhizus MCA 3950]
MYFSYNCSSTLPIRVVPEPIPNEVLHESGSGHDDLAGMTPQSGSLSETGNSSTMSQPASVVDTALPSPDTTTTLGDSEESLPEKMPSEACSVIGELFYTIAPTEFERYQRPDVVEDKHINYDIPRLTVSLARSELPQPWTSHTHPEGARYFRCEHDLFTIYTEARLLDPQILQAVRQFVDQVDEYLTRRDVTEVSFDTENVDLVLDVTLSDTKRTICGYYFAHHENRTVFWLDEFESSERLWPDINGVTSPEHILIDELRDIILHAIGGSSDSLVSTTSTISYSIEELRGMLQLLPARSRDNHDESGAGVSRIVYILMKHFAHDRFLHFYGEPAARLNRGTSIYDKNKVHMHSFLFHILQHLLFAAPCAHLHEIESMLSDGLLSREAWRGFIDKICQDWSHLTVYSTVLINVDVAFLSIQSVDTGPSSSPLKIFIYLSVVSSLGSIFFALLLLRRNNTRLNISTDEAATIMNSYQDSSYRIVFFVTAFMIMCLWNTAPVTLVLSSVAWVILGSLIIFYGIITKLDALLFSKQQAPSFVDKVSTVYCDDLAENSRTMTTMTTKDRTSDTKDVQRSGSELTPSSQNGPAGAPSVGSSSAATPNSSSLEPEIVVDYDSDFEDRGEDKPPTVTVRTASNAGGTGGVKKPK